MNPPRLMPQRENALRRVKCDVMPIRLLFLELQTVRLKTEPSGFAGNRRRAMPATTATPLRDVALRMPARARFPLYAAVFAKFTTRLRTVILRVDRRVDRAIAEFVRALDGLLHVPSYGLLMISPPASWALGMGDRVAPAGTVSC